MKRPISPATIPGAWCILCLALLGTDHAMAQQGEVDLLVVRDGWGNVKRETVRKMLDSVAAELVPCFGDQELRPIVVEPKGGPITLFQRGPGGMVFIRLNTGGTYWSQYAYQFAHELCHVLCHYDADPHGNDWFEESICEMASLSVLRRMGQTWKTSPPFKHWKSYAPHLTAYADDLLGKRRLPEGQTLAQWYAVKAEELHGTTSQRELNGIIATALLPLFEKDAGCWAAVAHLNDAKPKESQTFEEYLRDWHTHCPENCRPVVVLIAEEFGVSIK